MRVHHPPRCTQEVGISQAGERPVARHQKGGRVAQLPGPREAVMIGITTYFNNLLPMIPATEEVALAHQVQSGLRARRKPVTIAGRRDMLAGDKARNELVEANLYLIPQVAANYISHGLALDDLVQAGNLGLIEAAERFDPTKGVKFQNFATRYIRRNIRNACLNARPLATPRHISNGIPRVAEVVQSLTEELGREPNSEEIAIRAGYVPVKHTEEQMRRAAIKVRRIIRIGADPVSLDALRDGQGVDEIIDDEYSLWSE